MNGHHCLHLNYKKAGAGTLRVKRWRAGTILVSPSAGTRSGPDP